MLMDTMKNNDLFIVIHYLWFDFYSSSDPANVSLSVSKESQRVYNAVKGLERINYWIVYIEKDSSNSYRSYVEILQLKNK